MQILFAAAPGLGHLLPLLPFARAARERAHGVRIAVGADLSDVVQAGGFGHVPAGPPSLAEVTAEIPELAGLTGRRRAVTMVRHGFCDLIAGGIAADLLAAIASGALPRPDLIVHEDMELGTWLVAERLGIPHVTVQITAWRPAVRRLMAEAIDPLRDQHGLPGDAIERLLGEVFFTTRPASMRDPAEPFPSTTRELRPIADDDIGPPAAIESATAPGPRIAVTLGTVNAQQRDVLHVIVEGAAAVPDATVIVGLGGDPASFGEVPEGVRLQRYVPMSALLPTVDAVAFHGGSGTLTAALAAGRPMVIVPLAADQLDNADRAAAAGVAVAVPPEDLTPGAVRAALSNVLEDPSYRTRATEIAAEVAAMPGPDTALDHLEHLVMDQHARRQ
jgi:UDP:flavonoid glycosyltransferase YjiC (YdhE family)